MNTMKNRLKKCCQRNHAGSPRYAGCGLGAIVPGLRATNLLTAGMSRRPLATATMTMTSTTAIGTAHSRLIHRRPIRTCGGMPPT